MSSIYGTYSYVVMINNIYIVPNRYWDKVTLLSQFMEFMEFLITKDQLSYFENIIAHFNTLCVFFNRDKLFGIDLI